MNEITLAILSYIIGGAGGACVTHTLMTRKQRKDFERGVAEGYYRCSVLLTDYEADERKKRLAGQQVAILKRVK